MAEVKIEESWNKVLSNEFQQTYFDALIAQLKTEKQHNTLIYPPGPLIFNAFNQTPFDQVKVVILGQDPYHGAGQAHGLCFSVPNGVAPPPSLKNIYRELKSNYPEFQVPAHGNLEAWAKQGVFLLNAILTVRANTAASHAKIGWETFTDQVIRLLSAQKEHLVFILWGSFAKSKAALIDSSKHLILQSGHPSFADSHKQFFGHQHFKKCNDYLLANQQQPINWQV